MNPTNIETPNGQQRAIDTLVDDDPMTAGYRPSLPSWQFWGMGDSPILFILRDVELMITHPVVTQGLEYYKSGVAGAEFEVDADKSEAGEFIQDHCERFWDRGVPKLQNGYEYGWLGGENVYTTDNGPLEWDDLLDFAPRDSYVLTIKGKPVGVRIKNVDDKGNVDLWLQSDRWPDWMPSKGLWYPHRPRFGQFYGRSHLLSAWKPWKRLAWKDGAESVIDGGIYRFAYAGPVVRYPPEDKQAPPGSANTTADSQGRPRRFARDLARQMAEFLRTGGNVAMSSEKWSQETGGGFKWDIEWPDHVLNVDPLINYARYLHDMIYFGIGVPPELIQAAETGSGYSGRRIPMEAFLQQQQRIADAMLSIFVKQVLKPLVLWNFGPVKWNVKVKPLLETKNKQQGGEDATPRPQTQHMPGQQHPSQAPDSYSPNFARVPVMPMSMLAGYSDDFGRTDARDRRREAEIARRILRKAG